MHLMYFYGFIVLTIGTLELILQGLFNGFEWHMIFGDSVYNLILSAIDVMSSLVIVSLCISIYRRIIKPRNFLINSWQAFLILGLIFSLVITYFFMMGFRINYYALNETPFLYTLPVSRFFGSLTSGVCDDSQCALMGHEIFWWSHLLIVLSFGIFVVYSKHLHVIFAAPNIFLRNLNHKARLTPLNFEDETALQFGVAKVSDYSWKDVIDSYACTECGRCSHQCPANFTGKPLDPRKIVHDIQDALHGDRSSILELNSLTQNPEDYQQKREALKHITEYSSRDELWSCTTCGACMEWCPVFIEHVPKIIDARRNLVMMESSFPEEMMVPFKNLETNYNPWSFGWDQREAWANDLDVRFMRDIGENNPPEYLYWVGCAGSFDERNKKVSTAMVKILKAGNIDFAILGNEEKCTGDPARRMGNEYLAQTLIKENVQTFQKYRIQKVITTCPHCLNTLKNEYPDFGIKVEVVHHTQLIENLVTSKKIKLKEGSNEKIVFHDPCYLGRWNSEYDAPRRALKETLGHSNSLLEMERSKRESFCCGAGGGRMFMEETIGKRVNTERTEEALGTGATTIATGCPFCMTMITDGVKEKEGDQPKTGTLDVAEIIANQIHA